MEAVVTPAAESTPADPQAVLNSLTPEQRTEWKKTGTLPTPNKEESATSPADANSAAASQADAAESAPAPEAGKEKQEPPKKNAETRIKELLAERRAEKERADRAEARLKELDGKSKDAKPAEAAASSTAKAPVKPKIEEFDTIEAFEEAKDKYFEDLADFKAEQKVEKLKADQKKEREDAETAKQIKAAEDAWSQKLDAARKKYADFDDLVTRDQSLAVEIPEGSAMDRFIFTSEHGIDILYGLAKNREEIKRIAGLDALGQMREMVKLELALTSDKEEKPKKAPVKTVSDAPPPPQEVGGKGASPEDPVEDAAKRGDFSSYKKLANARDLKK
jgi:hypothetical protein